MCANWRYYRGKNKKRIINLIIGVLLLFIVGVAVPTWGPVTRLGVQAISIFIGLVYLAVTGFSFVFAGTIAMFAMQLTGFFTGSSIIAQSWGALPFTSLYWCTHYAKA